MLKQITQKKDLTQKQSEKLMADMMNGSMSLPMIAAVLTALHMKGETVNEITGMAKSMRRFSIKVPVRNPLLDTCGTGGTGKSTFNISTLCAFILAAAGVRVAKHGNRAVTGTCGSFDVLEALGARIELGPTQVAQMIQKTGLGFMFAPLFHPAMKQVMPARKEMKIPTVFNILGPLANPAGASYQVLGVSNPSIGPLMVTVLKKLGSKRVMAVCGKDGIDEITTTSPTRVWELAENGQMKRYTLNPSEYKIKRSTFRDIKGGDTAYNTQIFTGILSKTITDARRDIVVLNAAAGLYITSAVESIQHGIACAQRIIESKAGLNKLVEYISLSKTI